MTSHFPDNEAQLVNSLSKGNHLAFNELFQAYSGRLFRFALGYLKSREEAEELVQEVFTKVWERRQDLKEELSFKSYLFTIAFNIIRKHFNYKTRILEYCKSRINEDLKIQIQPTTAYDSLHQYINDLVNHLPQRRKEIFIKSRFEGLSIKEIAKELKISHKTVENQLTVALKFIRSNLNKESSRTP